MTDVVRVSARPGAAHRLVAAEFVDLGFDEIYLHHVGQEQRPFLDAFGEHVLPQLGVSARPVEAIDPPGPATNRRPSVAPVPAP